MKRGNWSGVVECLVEFGEEGGTWLLKLGGNGGRLGMYSSVGCGFDWSQRPGYIKKGSGMVFLLGLEEYLNWFNYAKDFRSLAIIFQGP